MWCHVISGDLLEFPVEDLVGEWIDQKVLERSTYGVDIQVHDHARNMPNKKPDVVRTGTDNCE